MSYAHKSGYQKRKERADRKKKLASAQKRQSSLTAFNFRSENSSQRVANNAYDESKTHNVQLDRQDCPSTSTAADQTNRQDIISVISYQPSTSTAPDELNNMHDIIETNRQDIAVAVTHSLTPPNDVECIEISSTENLTVVDLSRSEVEFQSQIIRNEVINEYDIGSVDMEFLQPKQVEEVIRRGHIKLPDKYPRDRLN